jgi:hypothetical protein
MATLFRPNGDADPVFALDIANGAQSGNLATVGANALVQMQGPKLDYFALVVENGSNQAIDLRNELGNVTDPGVIQTINQTVQTQATIAFYQVQNSTTGQISYGLYPTGAWTTTTLDTAITALGNVQITNSSGQTRGVNVSGSQTTNVGFKLALS